MSERALFVDILWKDPPVGVPSVMIHTTIKKTAIATWSPDFDRDSVVACASVSGALDDSFSTESVLELYSTENSSEVKLISTTSSEARYRNCLVFFDSNCIR